MRLILLIILSVTVLSNCGTVCAPAKLPLPPPLTYPKIKATELACLSDEAYAALNKRRVMCEKRVETLKGIIRQTR